MYQKDLPQRSKKPFLFVGIGLVAVLAVVLGVLVFGGDEPSTETAQQEPATETVVAEPPSGTLSSRFLFSGTVVTARAVENEARDATGVVNWAEVFSQFSSFQPEQYAEWFVDYECPVTTNSIPYRVQVDNTVFNCEPSVFPEASKYFTVANIANNHTRDQGDEGFIQTRQNIIDGGLQPVGHWDPRESQDACEVLSLTFTLALDGEAERQVELPVAACALHHFEKAPLETDFDVVEQYAAVMPVIGLMQVGVEYRAVNDQRQQEVARTLIDRGVDFVVGNSPHWVQNTEVYKGKLIVYSTGNFIFDQLDAETNRGLSLDVLLTTSYDDNLASWLELGASCSPEQFQDSCLQQAIDRNLQPVDFTYEYDVVGSLGGFRELTRLADPATQAAIEERANWGETLQALSLSQ